MAQTDEEKVAVKVISENRLGKQEVTYLDATTGSEINNIKDYNVVDANEYLRDIEEFNTQLSSSTSSGGGFAQAPSSSGGGVVGQLGPRGYKYIETGNNKAEQWSPNTKNIPNASNNFRYVDKPTGALSVLSRMPGQIGMAAKAVGAMMGVQNTHATGKAREYLGLEPNYLGNGLKNVLGDPNGFIGDVDIGGKTYAVGLGAQDPKGRTTLTPNEARTRAMTMGVGIRDASKDEKKAAQQNFKANKEVSPEAVREEADLGKNVFSGKMAAAETARAVESAPLGNRDYDLARGMGLGDLPAREMANVSYDLAGKGRSEVPTSGIADKVADVVTDVLGKDYTVNVTSGMEPAGRSPVGSAYRHPAGLAADLDIRDPMGRQLDISNPADKKAIEDVSQGFAARYNGNFGMGPEYMGTKTMHMDTLDLSKSPSLSAQWGSTGKAMAGTLDYAREYGLMPAEYYNVANAPTPQARPDVPEDLMAGSRMNPIQDDLTQPEALGSQVGFTSQPNAGYRDMPSYDEAMAGLSGSGSRFNGMTDMDRNMMAQTLAGEIDLGKTDLSTEAGRREAMGIMSTMENRSAKYGSIKDAISAPNQYSTWNNDAVANTAMTNYNRNPDLYDGLVTDYVTDPMSNLGFTSYHANTVNPGWSSSMTNPQQIGAHTFGSLPEYQSPAPTGFTAPTPQSRPEPQQSSLNMANQMESQQSTVDKNNAEAESSQSQQSQSDKSSSNSSNQSSGGNQSGSGGDSSSHGGGNNNGGKSANSSGSPDDRDER